MKVINGIHSELLSANIAPVQPLTDCVKIIFLQMACVE